MAPAASASATRSWSARSEEHTSELQSLRHLVCRLLLEKKNKPQRCSSIRVTRSSHAAPPRCGRAWALPTCRFFFNDTATTEIYTLSLHDAHPICSRLSPFEYRRRRRSRDPHRGRRRSRISRSEEHTSELQSLRHLVCRLLLE